MSPRRPGTSADHDDVPRRLSRRPRKALAAVALLLVLAGCVAAPAPVAPPRPLLNSERIAATFGSYGIEVLAADARVRVSDLYSTHGERRVTRTFAVVLFPAEVDPRVADAHAEVVAGGSLGATLECAGWSVEKDHLHLANLSPDDRLAAVYARMDVAPTPLALDVYRLTAVRSPDRVPYATIAELHHPDHLDLADLRAVYDPGRQVPSRASREVEAIVRRVLDAAERLRVLGRGMRID